MKKMKLLGIMTLTVLTLAGCQNPSDREAALEDQVAQLEQQVTSLEKENQELTVTPPASSENVASADTTSASEENDNLDSLTKAVDDAVKKADTTSANGTKEENQNKFFELKGVLQDVENRLERYEDSIEREYRQGDLSYDKARDTEIKIERLEEQLDNAEDSLEYKFGYDD